MRLISFAMAARNAEGFVGEALDSVPSGLQGTGVDYEVVLADGSSSDRTVEAALARPFVRLVSGSDAGIYDGMNKAIQAARGDLVVILNSDDQLVPAGLKAAIAGLATARELGMASGAVLTGTSLQDARLLRHDGPLSLAGAVFGIPVINGRVFRRRLFEDIGPFKTDIGLGADRELMIRLAARGVRGAAIEEPLYFYRHHHDSQTMANDRAGKARVYRAEAVAASYCLANSPSPEVRRLCAAASAIASLKLRWIGESMVNSVPIGPGFLADGLRGFLLWRQWTGRTSGA